MEASSPRSRIGGSWTGQVLASRRGGLTVAAVAALIAGVLLYLFVQHYKKNSTASTSTSVVFVAGSLIHRGTPSSAVISHGLLRRAEIAHSEARPGAITDPSLIAGEVALNDIAQGQQITVDDFTHSNVSESTYITGNQRVIALPLDSSHGLTSYINSGDHVDVIEIRPAPTKPTVLVQAALVLANSGGNVVLVMTDKQALAVTQASDDFKVWLDLRPATGAANSPGVKAQG